jgi:hypothetical protein
MAASVCDRFLNRPAKGEIGEIRGVGRWMILVWEKDEGTKVAASSGV